MADSFGDDQALDSSAPRTFALDDRIETIRDEVPAVRDTVYLNTGTCGPLPRRAVAAVREAFDTELAHGRIGPTHYPAMAEAVSGVKATVASVLGCDAEELALTRHTTDGMNIALAGLSWQPGDEIVVTNIEHPSGLLPSFLARRRYQVVTRVADIGLGGGPAEEIVAAIERQITPRTRLIVLSHIPYTTGAVLPLAEISAMAHGHGVRVLADAAQSYGQIPLDLHALGVDYYAMPGQKWMCGPEGTGVFYARAESLDALEQTFAGPFGMVFGTLDYLGATYELRAGTGRFDVGSMSLPLLAGQLAATRWIRDDVGLPAATQRISQLGRYAAATLGALPGVRIVTPRDRMAGLIAFEVEGFDPEDLTKRLLAEHNITIRFVDTYINNPRAARISTGFYNTREDIDRLAEAIQTLRRAG
ncbi:MAG TPA: aminotransferase class V-fold PLP-dependent enzyme [Ktedonobacterales bacterium]